MLLIKVNLFSAFAQSVHYLSLFVLQCVVCMSGFVHLRTKFMYQNRKALVFILTASLTLAVFFFHIPSSFLLTKGS